MGLLNFPNAPTNPGSLMGATREHRIALQDLQADAFRSASQKQNTGQAARAFSGANVTNTQTQTASLSQTASAQNIKTVTIGAVLSTNASVAGFNNNFLQRYIAGADAADFLARGAANVAQDQGGDQSAYAELNNFSGADSAADNSLTQAANLTQTFDVDLSATAVATTASHIANGSDAFDQSRFRSVIGDVTNNQAQAIFTSGQRQGHAEAPINQIAVGNGASSDNTLAQTATVTTTGNVNLTESIDLSTLDSANLAPRATELLERVSQNGAVNSNAASQDQVLMQSAAGGVDEDGNVTENGGDASNKGTSTASNTENTTVINSITITI